MPIWLRKFTFSEIKEHYDKERQQVQDSKKQDSKSITRPDIDPTYKSKASKK